MTREQLAHILRAASRVAGRREVIVIGSQVILGSFDDATLPGEAIGSVEADLCFFDDTDDALADQVDGAIGEASTFHATFGYYAQGVSVTTAILPPRAGSNDSSPTPRPTRSLPPGSASTHTTWWRRNSPPVARQRLRFVVALLRAGIVDPTTATDHVATLPIGHAVSDRLIGWINTQTA